MPSMNSVELDEGGDVVCRISRFCCSADHVYIVCYKCLLLKEGLCA